jgi:hypothetical protein
MVTKIYGVLKSPDKPKQKRTSKARIRRPVRVNNQDLSLFKVEAKKAYPGKRSFQAYYLEDALSEFLSRDGIVSADFENSEDESAAEFAKNLMLYMKEDDLSHSNVFSISKPIYENLYGYEVLLRRFFELHRDWFDKEPHIDKIFPALMRYAIAVKVRKARSSSLITALRKGV